MDGLLIVDKPRGVTSHDVVNVLRRATGERSVGHLGTLDPMATGVLPMLLGRWTRLSQFFSAAHKAYDGEVRFGFATDTYDADGTPAGEAVEPHFDDAQLQAAAATLRGRIQQMPPAFSAKKIDGQPAYKLARKGIQPELKPVEIQVSRLDVTRTAPDRAAFEAEVSSGSYIRSLAHSLGQQLGCGAHLSALRRTQVGEWTLTNATPLDELKQLQPQEIRTRCLPLQHVLPELPIVYVSEETAAKLRNGMQVNLGEFTHAPLIKLAVRPAELIGIGRRLAGTLFAPHIMFPAASS